MVGITDGEGLALGDVVGLGGGVGAASLKARVKESDSSVALADWKTRPLPASVNVFIVARFRSVAPTVTISMATPEDVTAASTSADLAVLDRSKPSVTTMSRVVFGLVDS